MGSNWQYASIGSDNGLALCRRQAIIWINADPIHWRIYAALGGDELLQKRCNYSALATELRLFRIKPSI